MDRATRQASRIRGAGRRVVETTDLVLNDEFSDNNPPRSLSRSMSDSLKKNIVRTPVRKQRQVPSSKIKPKIPTPKKKKNSNNNNPNTISLPKISTPKQEIINSPTKVSSSRKNRKSLTNSLNNTKNLIKNKPTATPKRITRSISNNLTPNIKTPSIKTPNIKPPIIKKRPLEIKQRSIQKRRRVSTPKEGPKNVYAKRNTTYKTFDVEIKRLFEGLDARRTRINALDIVSSAIFEFLKNYKESIETPGERKLIDKFNDVLYDSVWNMLDLNNLISNLNSNIKEATLKKNELREKIFKIRQENSKKINHNLEVIRFKNSDLKLRNLKQIELNQNLYNLKHTKSTENDYSLSNEIDTNLANLNQLINPTSGILDKLKLLNEKLQLMNDEIIKN